MAETLASIRDGLRAARYVADPRIEIAVYLALTLEKPLLVEGPAGVGKTELAKAIAELLDTRLVRLQCYEGLDEAHALYEWNYHKQLLRLQADTLRGGGWESLEADIFSRPYLLERPLLAAITAPRQVVLLIDEVDRADEEFEAFLLEVLGEFQITVPELGTLRARERPVALLTSNRVRELSEALRRRCLHLALEFPDHGRELEILRVRVPELEEELGRQVARFVAGLRRLDLRKAPSVAETIDWARALVALGVKELDPEVLRQTLGLVLKHEQDCRRVEPELGRLVGPPGAPRSGAVQGVRRGRGQDAQAGRPAPVGKGS